MEISCTNKNKAIKEKTKYYTDVAVLLWKLKGGCKWSTYVQTIYILHITYI